MLGWTRLGFLFCCWGWVSVLCFVYGEAGLCGIVWGWFLQQLVVVESTMSMGWVVQGGSSVEGLVIVVAVGLGLVLQTEAGVW